MAYFSPNNQYHILYNVYSGGTSTPSLNAFTSNSYEVLKAVYDDTNHALAVKFVSPITITESVTILADLTVSGTTTYINVVDLNVADNIICINSGETGAGVTLGTAGLEVDRGTEVWAQLLWDESVSGWTGGIVGDMELLARIESAPVDNGVMFYNSTDNVIENDSSFTYNGSLLSVTSLTTSDLTATTLNSTTGTITTINVTTGNITTVNSTTVDSINGSFTNLSGLNVTGTTLQSTDIYTTNINSTNGDFTSVTATTLFGDIDWAYVNSTPTTIAGYGITDAYTKTECDSNYLSASTTLVTSLDALTDVTISTVATDDILVYNGAEWVNTATTWFEITNPQDGDMIIYNGSDWVNTGASHYLTEDEAAANFLSASTSFYTQAQTDANFLSANTSLFDGAYGSLTGVPDFDSMYLSASTVIPTDFYTQAEADANFLSANTSLVTSLDDLSDVNLGTPSANYVLTYDGAEWIASAATYVLPDTYTKTETDANFLSANTALFDGAYGSLTGVPDFDTMYLSASTTAADIGGITAQYVADNFLSANTSLFDGAYGSLTGVPDFDSMYLSANTAIPSDFYTTGEADANFLSANTSYYTQAQANNNFLSATTSYYTQAQANANFLSANTYEEKSFQIEFATQTPYYLTSYAPYAYDVITLYTFTNSGSCNISLSGGSDGATAIGSLTNVTTDTSLDTTNATSANTISAGHMLKLVVNSTTNASTLYGTIKIQRK